VTKGDPTPTNPRPPSELKMAQITTTGHRPTGGWLGLLIPHSERRILPPGPRFDLRSSVGYRFELGRAITSQQYPRSLPWQVQCPLPLSDLYGMDQCSSTNVFPQTH
jgi:hypothetical protein